jgi:hypothetical protein
MESSYGDFFARIGDNYRLVTRAEFLVAAALATAYKSVTFKNGNNPL